MHTQAPRLWLWRSRLKSGKASLPKSVGKGRTFRTGIVPALRLSASQPAPSPHCACPHGSHQGSKTAVPSDGICMGVNTRHRFQVFYKTFSSPCLLKHPAPDMLLLLKDLGCSSTRAATTAQSSTEPKACVPLALISNDVPNIINTFQERVLFAEIMNTWKIISSSQKQQKPDIS